MASIRKLLADGGSYYIFGCIGVQYVTFSRIWVSEDWVRCEQLFEYFKCDALWFVPVPLSTFLGKIM